LKKQIVIVKQAVSILPHEAKYTLLELQYFATSRTWLAELVTWQAWTIWLSQLTVTSVNGSVYQVMSWF